jgi:hypothetical protein
MKKQKLKTAVVDRVAIRSTGSEGCAVPGTEPRPQELPNEW